MNKETDYMEELWAVKDELSSRFTSFRDFFNDMLKWQHDEEAKGRDFVRLPGAQNMPAMA